MEKLAKTDPIFVLESIWRTNNKFHCDERSSLLENYYHDGSKRTSTIAQFQNNKWQKIGELKEIKSDPSAILYDGEYLIIGGEGRR